MYKKDKTHSLIYVLFFYYERLLYTLKFVSFKKKLHTIKHCKNVQKDSSMVKAARCAMHQRISTIVAGKKTQCGFIDIDLIN